MPVCRILQLGDPVLREVSQPVTGIAEIARPALDLRDTLHEFRRNHGFGRGISAVQIGVLLRVIYIEFEGAAYTLVNPEYESRSGEKFRLWDDCFSFPDLLAWVERSVSVVVRYLDEGWQERRLEAAGPLSELLQHEMDHLDGVLAVDRAIGPNGLMTRAEFDRTRPDRVASRGGTV